MSIEFHWGEANKYALEAAKSLFIFNNGSAIALISIFNKDIYYFLCPISLFFLGSILDLIYMACSYYANLYYGNRDCSHNQNEKDGFDKKAKKFHKCAERFGWFALLTPIISIGFTIYIISNLPNKDTTISSQNIPSSIVNDITQLNPIMVERIIAPHSIEEIAELVKTHQGPISIGGGRYSQGGQIATEQALFIDMRSMNRIINLDLTKRLITVEAGTTWRKIQEAIDPHNLSLRIMQTYSNFTVGGSISVNVHGRYIGEGALIKSLVAITLVCADGSIKKASRDINPELFYNAVGGYGGVGIIVDATLELTDNVAIARSNVTMPIGDYKKFFFETIRPSTNIVFHNADIYPPNFTTINAISWSKTEKQVTVSDRLKKITKLNSYEQFMLDWVTNGILGKEFRQYIYDPYIFHGEKIVWRNYEASYDVAGLEPASREKQTYVLQEYFVPVEHFDKFTVDMSKIFKKYSSNIINVSIRHALPDHESTLSWSRNEVFAFVVYYAQGTTNFEKAEVAKWTSELIDAVLKQNGTYYLPYQLIATNDQFTKSYPNAKKYFEFKNIIDPTYKFRNKLWDKYYIKNNN